ncbi:MAG: hypothetical protein U0325_18325 [Polyangiales bacterium]
MSVAPRSARGLILLSLLSACGSEVVGQAEEPDLHPSLADADLPEGADVPLLPPIVDDDVPVEADAPPGLDASAGDAGAIRDVTVAPGDVPPPRCEGSASGQSSVWACTASGAARERCVLGRVEEERCPNGCIRRAPVTADVCAPRCEGSASGQADTWTCTGNGEARERCVLGRVEEERCPNGCIRRDAGANDVCAPRCEGSSSGQSSLWTCTANEQSRQRCVLGRVETDPCRFGCVRRPSGTPDVCATEPPSNTLPACARRPLLRWGLHPDASDHLRCAGVPAERIVQTIGSAPASAGTHGPDGTVNGQPYSAATDLSTRGLATSSIHELLDRLANQGFAAWYRWPGHDGWPSSESPHIHAIYVGARMKTSLRSQVASWLVGRNGLVSNTTYQFHTWTASQRALIRAVYARFN